MRLPLKWPLTTVMVDPSGILTVILRQSVEMTPSISALRRYSWSCISGAPFSYRGRKRSAWHVRNDGALGSRHLNYALVRRRAQPGSRRVTGCALASRIWPLVDRCSVPLERRNGRRDTLPPPLSMKRRVSLLDQRVLPSCRGPAAVLPTACADVCTA